MYFMEDENQWPAKRVRTEEESGENNGASPDATISRHPHIWFDDGNVIMQAEYTQFKVHRSVLSSQSQIFKDMFSLPQPPPPLSSDSDDCPIIPLPDSAVDIENVLSLLYDTMRIYNRREKMSLSVLGSMLRLGRKYRFKHLATEALHCIKLEFPSELDLWDTQRAKGMSYIKETPAFLFDVVYLAHEFSMKSILPGVYALICSKFSLGGIREGFNRPHSRHLLKTEEPISCLSGREKLYRAAPQKTYVWTIDGTVPVQNCKSLKRCADWIGVTTKVTLSRDMSFVVGLSAHPWRPNVDNSLCAPCRNKAKATFEGARGQVWDELADYFELNDKDFDAPWHTDSFSDEA